MNMTHALRIAWKDYRRIGGLWVAFFGFWMLCLACSIGLAFYNQDFRFPATMSQGSLAALITVLIYALSWAGLTFAAEHEDKMFGYLRSLPVSPISVFYGKLIFGVVSSFLLAAALLALREVHSAILASQGGGYVDHSTRIWWESLGLYLTMACVPLAIAIGLFWSLCLKRPLRSLVVTAISLVVVTQLCVLIMAIVFSVEFGAASRSREALWGTSVAGLMLLGVSIVLFFVDRRLAVTWLPNYQTVNNVSKPVPITATQPRGFRRLFWLARRTNGSACLLLLALGVVSAFCMMGPLVFVATGGLGLICFRPDYEENRFRLLAQLGVNRTEYWVSRLMLPTFAVAVVMATDWWTFVTFYPSGLGDFELVRWATFACLIVFSIGQLCSLAFGSLVIAGAMTLLATIVVCMWAYLCERLWVPWPLIYLPPILLPLVASYLRVPRWFRETGSWKQWIVPAIPLLLLFVGTPLAAALYRVYEIPGVTLPADIVEGMKPTAAEEAKMEEYRQLFARLPRDLGSYGSDGNANRLMAWVADNGDVVEELTKATESGSGFPQEHNETGFGSHFAESSDLVGAIFITRSALAGKDGDSSKAWEYYASALRFARQCNDGHSGSYGQARAYAIERMVYPKLVPWAMMSDNNERQIAEAIDFLQDHHKQQRPLRDVMRGGYAQTEVLLNNHQKAAGYLRGNSQRMAQVIHFAPWELARSRRLRDLWFAKSVEAIESTTFGRPGHAFVFPGKATPTYLEEFLLWTPSYFAEDEFVRAGVICQLAAILHRMKTGEYPKDLNELEPSPNKLQIVLSTDLHDAAPFLCASDVDPQDPDYQWFTDLNQGHTPTMLLLPMDAEWDPERFQQRMYANSIDGLEEANAARDLTRAASFLDVDRPSLSTPATRFMIAGYGTDVPSAVAVLNKTAPDALVQFAEEFVRDAILTDDENETQLEVLSQLVGKQDAVKFVPELARLLDSEDVAIAARASQILRQFMVNQWLPEEQWQVIRPRRSTEEGRSTLTSFGLPIRNHVNGHYYELVRFFDPADMSLLGAANSWNDALNKANSRRFRGMRGHLATITSAEEDAFVTQMLSVAISNSNDDQALAWIGGKKEANEQQWTWATGPERGQPINQDAQSFIRWQAETPFDSEDEKYLARVSSLFDGGQNETEGGTWWVAADKYELGQAWVLVEYSVDEEQPSVEEPEPAHGPNTP